MSDSKEKNFVQEISEFFRLSKNFLINCQRPDKKGKNKFQIIYLIYRIYENC